MVQKKQQNKKKPQVVNKPAVETKPKQPRQLIIRLAIVAVVAIVCILYTDSKGYFLSDQQNRHHERRWESFYRMTPQDTIDVVVLGNSHSFCGVNPKNLSAALGCNCFVMAFNASTVPDAYFVLKEVLTRTTPKVVVMETFNFRNLHNHELNPSDLSNQFRSFYPRRNFWQKIMSMPVLFTPDNYLPAWSSTLRNHEILFRNNEEIAINLMIQEQKKIPDNRLYLGRFVRFTTGITDSVMHLYDSLGPAVDGATMDVSDEEMVYAKKIVDLCRSKGIKPLFLTVPIYYKNLKNADVWTQNLWKAIGPTQAPWLNLQTPYDTLMFDRNCFESIHSLNQHMTYQGSLITTYKLAHYIVDSLDVALPYRANTPHWRNMFYGEEGFFENFTPDEGDRDHRIVARDTVIDGIHLIDCVVDREGSVTVKIDPKTPLASQGALTAEFVMDGKPMVATIPLSQSPLYNPIRHQLYFSSLRPDIILRKIISIR